MGKESLQQFLGDWAVHPLHTFRQGFRRTWIVRSTQQPVEKTVFHDYGLAVIKEAAPRRMHQHTERYQVPRADRPVQFVKEQTANYPKSWAGIVSSTARTEIGPKRVGTDGTVSAMVASTVAVAAAGPRPQNTTALIPSEPARPVPVSVLQQSMPNDLAQMMTAAIEAALRPMKERLEATIIPMQRTIESLQAEFIASRAEEKDGDAVMVADAKRMRMGPDT